MGGRGLKERDHLEDLVVKGMILRWVSKEVGLGGMDWIDTERTGQLPRKDCAAWSYQGLTVFVQLVICN
jgi:hypothetical protein